MLTLKRFLQTSFLLVLSFNAFAQPASKDWMFSVEGSYYHSKSDQSDPLSQLNTEEKDWHLSFNAERFITDQFSVGLGLARYHEIADEYNQQSVVMATGYGLLRTFVEAEGTYWLPRVFCKYYLPVIGHFYLVPRFTGSYGKAKVQAIALTASVYQAPLDELTEIVPGTSESWGVGAKGNLLSLEMSPELAYLFSNHWGFSACFGGLRHDRFSGDLSGSDWTLSFKRQYWKLGVNFRF